jgi:hypothetical protein
MDSPLYYYLCNTSSRNAPEIAQSSSHPFFYNMNALQSVYCHLLRMTMKIRGDHQKPYTLILIHLQVISPDIQQSTRI